MAWCGTVVVIGLGRFGAAIALGLARRGADVLAIDIREHIVQLLADGLPQAACADGTDPLALQQLGVATPEQAVVAIDSDVEDSMLCTLALAELKVPAIWAEASSPAHAKVLKHLGAHRILMPAHDAAQQARNTWAVIGNGASTVRAPISAQPPLVSRRRSPPCSPATACPVVPSQQSKPAGKYAPGGPVILCHRKASSSSPARPASCSTS